MNGNEFLERLEADRARRVVGGEGELVHPREIMIPTPERRATTIKKDVDSRVPTLLPLAVAEEIMAYRPIEVVERIAPGSLLIVAVENDPVTPTDHARALYDRAGPPKKLIIQRHTTHYAAYRRYGKTIIAPDGGLVPKRFEDSPDQGCRDATQEKRKSWLSRRVE